MPHVPFWVTFIVVTASMLASGQGIWKVAKFWGIIFGFVVPIFVADYFWPGFADYTVCVMNHVPMVCRW